MHVNTPYPIQFGSGDWITVVTNATGTFTGEMTLPDGNVIAPTGKAFDLEFGQTTKWDGDRLIVISAFWDAASAATAARPRLAPLIGQLRRAPRWESAAPVARLVSRRLGGLPCGPDATGLPAIASSAACARAAGAEIAFCVAGVQHLIGVLELAVVVAPESRSEGLLQPDAVGPRHDLGYVPAWVVWASIVRSSAPSVTAPCGASLTRPPGFATSAPRFRSWPRGAPRRASRPGTAGG